MMWYPWFKIDALNGFVVWAIGLFFVLITLYSSRFMKGRPGSFHYYLLIVFTFIAALGAALANHLILLLVFWGFLGLTLYLLIAMNQEAAAIAKKTLVIVGGADALMIFGIGVVYHLGRTFQMDAIHLETRGVLATTAYLCIAVGCFAKAGAMPFHTWIPDCAKLAPLPVVAYLPASLDKLLGIYLLARVSLDLFVLNTAINSILMLVGAFTIIAGVMMALVQHNMKKLLGYHAVSQVGYMVLGIGTGNPVGIAGGIFHMLNHAVYKSCLFLTAGNVEYRAQSAELDKLGGFAKAMPVTYICALVASLSISGVPPFNGFFSKWMVYQGIINHVQDASFWVRSLSVICLIAAMFGSALTLASFMKFIHAVFLGQKTQAKSSQGTREVGIAMWLPCVVLAVVCVAFGVWALQVPLRTMIFPAVPGVNFIGNWYAGASTFLIALGLLAGALIAQVKLVKPALRQDASFIGGEPLNLEGHRVSGIEFYNTVKDFSGLRKAYQAAGSGIFDIYEQGKRLLSVNKALQFLHNGVLPTYLGWVLLGLAGLLLVLVR